MLERISARSRYSKRTSEQDKAEEKQYCKLLYV